MSCNTCQSKFSFFTKEVGCANCGFSYCSKCLKYKHVLLNLGERKVCGKCYNRLQKEAKLPAERVVDAAVPDGLKQPLAPIDLTLRVESLENPSRAPITMYKQQSKLDLLKTQLDPADVELVNRLKKLKNEDKQVSLPTEEEIRRRLALLKDQNPDVVRPTVNLLEVDTRTDQQKSDELINEYLDQLSISKANDAADRDIQARLDNLRGIDSSKNPQQSIADIEEDDENTVVQNLIEKAIAEASLEAKFGESFEDPDSREQQDASAARDHENNSDGESCAMCEQTRNLVSCRGCHGDLYCRQCFENNHDEMELREHRATPYGPRESDGY